MKRNLAYLLVFIIFALVGCKDDENQTKDDGRVYPEVPQTPFQVTNRKGMLTYNVVSKEWQIRMDYKNHADTIYCVKEFPNDFQPEEYKDIIFSGEGLFLYAIKLIPTAVQHYCSLELSEIAYDLNVKTRADNLRRMECGTPAPEPPLWFFAPQTRNVILNNYLINVFVHVVRSSSGLGYNKDLVSQAVITNLNDYYKNSYISFQLKGNE